LLHHEEIGFRCNFRAPVHAKYELPFSTVTLNWHL